jgi:hypothetical protein
MKSTGTCGHRLPRRWGWLRLSLGLLAMWLLFGLVLILEHGNRPTTTRQWVLWLLLAPVAYVLCELLATAAGTIAARMPPFSWLLRWVGSGIDSTDRIFRVGLLAIVFLILFFIGLGIYTHLLGI